MQAWASLGAVFMSDKAQQREALYAYREASKLKPDAWEVNLSQLPS